MTKFIRKYQKAFLAVFGVALMVIFIIPSAFKSGRGGTDSVIGNIGKQPVYAGERDEAEHEWKVLSYIRDRGYQGQPEPISALYLGDALFNEIEDKPLLFLLLQKEAIQQGVIADDAGADRFIDPKDLSAEAMDKRQAIHGMLLVAGLRQQLANAVKDSLPLETHELAKYVQKAKLSVVTFKADQFKDSIPTPTMDQLHKMYDNLSHVLPNSTDVDSDNPFLPQPSTQAAGDSLGFGYELPRRVKVQYIEIPRQTLLDAVAKKKSDYLWEVDAREYYYSHESDFPTTHPGTNPATAPMTQPYVETKRQILDQLRGPDADLLAAQIRQTILAKLDRDYAQYIADQPATHPSTRPAAPASQPARDFGTEHYLDQITLDISKEFGVLPIVHEITDFESAADLGNEIAIGDAKAPDQTAFADYAVGSDDPSAKDNMSVYEPSKWLSDPSNNNYIFRLTAVAPAAPAPFDTVQTAVAADWVTQHAYDKALAAAKDLSSKAKGKWLPTVAMASGFPAFNTEFFLPQSESEGPPIPGTIVDPKAQSKVANKAQQLLTDASEQDPHPVGVVEIPVLRSAIVTQLIGTELALPPGDLWKRELMDFYELNQRSAQLVARQYFTYDAVVKRIAFVWAPGEKGT